MKCSGAGELGAFGTRRPRTEAAPPLTERSGPLYMSGLTYLTYPIHHSAKISSKSLSTRRRRLIAPD